MGNDVDARLRSAASEIIADAIRRLNVEKGHDLCSEECSCPLSIRMVEDHLLQGRERLARGTKDDD